MLCIWNFNNLTCIFLAKVTETLIHLPRHYSFVKEEWGLPSLSWHSLGFPSQLLFTFHIHTCLTNIIYTISLVFLTKHVVQMRHFSKCPMEFQPKPISKIRENLPMNFGSCRPSHMIFLQCVPLAHSSNSQTINHYLIIQSKLIVP